MNNICSVPNCKNTTGARFPLDEDLKKLWLEKLQIGTTLNDNSFVCLEHFVEEDFLENGLKIADNLKDAAVPSLIFDYKVQDEVSNWSKVEQQMQIHDYTGDEVIQHQLQTSKLSDFKNENNLGHLEQHEEKKTITAVMANGNIEPIIMCRLCMGHEQTNFSVDDHLEENCTISEAIGLCIYPLNVRSGDGLSKLICATCVTSLRNYHKFRKNCLHTNEIQRANLESSGTLVINGKRKSDLDTCDSLKKLCKEEKRPTLQDIVAEATSESDETHSSNKIMYINNFGCLKEYAIQEINNQTIIKGVSEKPYENGANCKRVTKKYTAIKSPKKCEKKSLLELDKEKLMNEKYDKVEEELRKLLEGTLTDEEQVIVRVVSDDEDDKPKKNKHKIPDEKSVDQSRVVKIGGSEEVILPKGITVKISDKFQSSVGTFQCTVKTAAFGIELLQVDKYLFESRLYKGSERYLRCITARCPSTALQKVTRKGEFDKNVLVKVAHDHLSYSPMETVRQMFYYTMRKQLQSAKEQNFNSVYESICSEDPRLRSIVPMRSVIKEICKHQISSNVPSIKCFDDFYNGIEDDRFHKLQFTTNGNQFYQERFIVKEERSRAVLFANCELIKRYSSSKLMFVDASFRINKDDDIYYQLVTVLVWVQDFYFPIAYVLVNKCTIELYKKIFEYLHDVLAPELRPHEIVTDYESSIYYALGETYLDSNIGGSIFYYTQNLYKKICSLNLSKDLESNSHFRNIFHLLLMLPLLPVNTILDGLHNIEVQAKTMGVAELSRPVFQHVKKEWLEKVTPELFCVHRLENRINENVMAPFKKLRDLLLLTRGGRISNNQNLILVVEKLIELENFLEVTYHKKAFGRDLSCSQKKNVLKAWQYIESHPRININNFFTKVLGYIKCMENQLWIWGYYKFAGDGREDLIDASNFSIVKGAEEELVEFDDQDMEVTIGTDEDLEEVEEEEEIECEFPVYSEDSAEDTVIVEAVLGPSGEFVLPPEAQDSQFDQSILKLVYKK